MSVLFSTARVINPKSDFYNYSCHSKNQSGCPEHATGSLAYTVTLSLSQTTNFGLFQTERVCRRQLQIY